MKKLSHSNAVYLDSQALKKINYDEEDRVLEATFNNNRVYQYKKVPGAVWSHFLKAIYKGASAGAFINTEIKPFYDCVEVTR